jgi:predicted DNA-binding protein (UPF0278 family)
MSYRWQKDFQHNILKPKLKLNTVLFTDDQVIIAENEENLQKAMHKLIKIIKEYNLTISTKKTKVMAFTGKHTVRSKIIIYDTLIEQVNHFNYVGCNTSIFDNKDLETKLRKFNHTCGTIRRILNKKTRKETQIKFYKVMAIPTLTYSSETWTLTKKQRQNIETAEMKFLRNVAGYTLKDQIRNTVNQKQTKNVQLK